MCETGSPFVEHWDAQECYLEKVEWSLTVCVLFYAGPTRHHCIKADPLHNRATTSSQIMRRSTRRLGHDIAVPCRAYCVARHFGACKKTAFMAMKAVLVTAKNAHTHALVVATGS